MRAWIDAIATGDDDTMVELVAPRSLAAFGGEQGVRDEEIALSEGWGAWSSAEGLELTVTRLDATTAIVTLHGEVSQEGPPQESWAAIPVVITGEGDRVEPFLDLGNVEADPPANRDIDPAGTVAAFVLGNRDVRFVVDGGQAMEPTAVESADGDQQRAQLDISSLQLQPGLHGVTVVVTNDDGVMARTFLYAVA